MEEWRDIEGFKGLYQVSNLGRVKSLKKGIILSICDNGNGYKVVNLKVNRIQHMKTVHRLVATAFIPNPENKKEINHKNGDKSNNSVENLEWCTRSENGKHAYRTGLRKVHKGFDNPNSRLSKEDVEYIRTHYKKYDPEFGAEALGRKFGISATSIKYCIWGRRYVVL